MFISIKKDRVGKKNSITLFGAAYTLADALQRNGTAAWIAVMIGNPSK